MKHRTIALLASASVALAAPAMAAPLVVLGDSTSDAGSFNISSGGSVASSDEGYFQGRFTNGPNVADYVNLGLNGELTTSYLAGGDNFAFGGAAIVTDVNQGPGGLPSFIPDLADQVTSLLGRGTIEEDTDLFVSFAGNDFLAAARGAIGAQDVAALAAISMEEQLRRLAGGGATNVTVSNVAAGGFRLAGANEVADGIDVYNAALADLLVRLSSETGTRFALFDRDAVFDMIVADPVTYGFDLTLPGNCQDSLDLPVDETPACEGYVSFDGTHVTTAVAEIFAREALSVVNPVPLPGAAILFGAGLTGLITVRRAKG